MIFAVLYLPVDPWIRAFLGLGTLFLTTSVVHPRQVRPRRPGEPVRGRPARPGPRRQAARRARPVPVHLLSASPPPRPPPTGGCPPAPARLLARRPLPGRRPRMLESGERPRVHRREVTVARTNPLGRIKNVAIDSIKDPRRTAETVAGQARGTVALGRVVVGQVGTRLAGLRHHGADGQAHVDRGRSRTAPLARGGARRPAGEVVRGSDHRRAGREGAGGHPRRHREEHRAQARGEGADPPAGQEGAGEEGRPGREAAAPEEDTHRVTRLPDPALVVLVGPSGLRQVRPGRPARYRREEIVSSDALRGVVGSGPHDLDASDGRVRPARADRRRAARPRPRPPSWTRSGSTPPGARAGSPRPGRPGCPPSSSCWTPPTPSAGAATPPATGRCRRRPWPASCSRHRDAGRRARRTRAGTSCTRCPAPSPRRCRRAPPRRRPRPRRPERRTLAGAARSCCRSRRFPWGEDPAAWLRGDRPGRRRGRASPGWR